MSRRRVLVTPISVERYRDLPRLSDVLAPPYDVIDDEARAVLEQRDPHNIVRLILPRGDAERYARARVLLDQWRAEGVLTRETAAVYVVQETFETPDHSRYVRTGVIAGVVAEPFELGRVRPHERTHAGPKADRLALLAATRTALESLFLFTPDERGELQALLRAETRPSPWATARLAGVAISLWRVPGRRGQAIAKAAGPRLYIADGHHRYETAVAFARQHPTASRVPALIVPMSDSGLVILPTHRLVSGDAFALEPFVESLRRNFQVHELRDAADSAEELSRLRDRGTACVLITSHGPPTALLLRGRPDLGSFPHAGVPAVASLDVARVDALVVEPLIAAMGEGARVSYSASGTEAVELVKNQAARAAVLLNAPGIEQVVAVADAGAAMPPKSTYFFPKVPSGLALVPY